jgi:parvulin-like peptidyl-prolyl isomerase
MTDAPNEPKPPQAPASVPSSTSRRASRPAASKESSAPAIGRPNRPSRGVVPRRSAWSRFIAWFASDPEASPATVREVREARIATVVLGAIVVVSVLVTIGAVTWDRFLYGRQAMLKVDGSEISVETYRSWFSYRQNLLIASIQQAESMGGSASQPTPAPGDSAASQAYSMKEMWRQRASQLQGQLNSLSSNLTDEFIERPVIRAEAKRRNIVATPDEVDAELRSITGWQDPAGTPTPGITPSPMGATAVPATLTPAPPTASPTPDPALPTPTVVRTPRPTATSRAKARRPNTLDQAISDFAKFAGGSPEIIREDAEIAVLRRKLGETIADETPKTGEQVKARHILVADEDAAKKVVERVKGGESFDTVAAEVSTDGSNKDKGGDLGWFGKGMMVSEFETAAYALKVGEISAPVKTQFGWHVIRLDDRDATKPLDDAQWSRAKEETFPKWLEKEREAKGAERLLTESMREWVVRNVTPLDRTALRDN